MTDAEVARNRWVAQEIARDCESDAQAMEGRPFTGRVVAASFGETLAMVSALAHLVDALYADVHPGIKANETP